MIWVLYTFILWSPLLKTQPPNTKWWGWFSSLPDHFSQWCIPTIYFLPFATAHFLINVHFPVGWAIRAALRTASEKSEPNNMKGCFIHCKTKLLFALIRNIMLAFSVFPFLTFGWDLYLPWGFFHPRAWNTLSTLFNKARRSTVNWNGFEIKSPLDWHKQPSNA